jgi:hypothetical protein
VARRLRCWLHHRGCWRRLLLGSIAGSLVAGGGGGRRAAAAVAHLHTGQPAIHSCAMLAAVAVDVAAGCCMAAIARCWLLWRLWPSSLWPVACL